MIDHYPEVSKAHASDDLLFGTVESWVLYASQIYVFYLSHNDFALESGWRCKNWSSRLRGHQRIPYSSPQHQDPEMGTVSCRFLWIPIICSPETCIDIGGVRPHRCGLFGRRPHRWACG